MKISAVVVGCALPLIALVAFFAGAGDPLQVLREGGMASLAVLASTLLFGLAAPALAGFTPAPRVLWALLAMVPVCVGVIGTLMGQRMVSAAIALVSPADKMMLASQGTAEVAAVFALALLAGGACVVGVALVVVVVERNPGAVGLLAVAGAGALVGLRWLPIRQALSGFARADAAEKATLVAEGLASAQVVGFAVVGVGVALLVGGVASLLRAGPWAPVSSTAGLGLTALVLAALTAGTHLSLSGLTAHASQTLPASVVHFDGGDSGAPGLWIKAGSSETLQGQPEVFVVDVAARGQDLRRALATMAGDAPAIFVSPLPRVEGLSIPQVLEPVVNQRVSGTRAVVLQEGTCMRGTPWPCLKDEGEALRQVIILGPKRARADVAVDGVRYLLRPSDGELDLLAVSTGLAFDDDVDALSFAQVLGRVKSQPGQRERAVQVIVARPPSLEALQLPAPVDDADEGLGFGSGFGSGPGASAGGGLDRAVISRVVRSHQAQVKYCYERALVGNGSLKGTASAHFGVGAEGRVTSVKVDAPAPLKAVAACIEKQIQRWVFPAPEGGDVVEVTYPFLFSPSL